MRAALAMIDVYLFPLPGASDGPYWDTAADKMSQDGVAGTFAYFETGCMLYIWFMSFLYALFGRSVLMIHAINVLFGALVVHNVFRISKTLGANDQTSTKVAWLTAVFPTLVLYSAVLLREVAVVYPLSLGVLHLVRWSKTRRAMDMIFAGAFLLLSMMFHSGGFAVLLGAGCWIAGGWVKSFLSGKLDRFVKNSVALAVALAAVVVVASTGWGMQKFSNVDTSSVDKFAQKMGKEETPGMVGRTQYLQDSEPESFSGLILQTPLRLVYFLFAPFPWMVSSPIDAFGLIDSAFYLWLAWRVFKGRRLVAQNPAAVLVLAVFAAMALVFAMGVSNYGTAMRHRAKMLPLLIAVAAVVPSRRAMAKAPAPRQPIRPTNPGNAAPPNRGHEGRGNEALRASPAMNRRAEETKGAASALHNGSSPDGASPIQPPELWRCKLMTASLK
jgi:hypothetical protein